MKARLTLFVCLLATAIAVARPHDDSVESQSLRKINKAIAAISTLYVDSVDSRQLAEEAIKGMLGSLDPHSSYSTAEESRLQMESLNGSFEGIGIRYNMVQDTLLIVSTIPDGPSERAGLLPGDRILAVDDTTIAGVNIARADIIRRVRGKKGSKVALKVLRRGIDGLLHFTITRDKIPLKTINAAYMADSLTGYVHISNFGANTHEELMDWASRLKEQGMSRLILDLQDNGGGYLRAAIDIANEFLDKGELTVYTEGRSEPRDDHKANGRGRLKGIPVVVLINEYTASASEIVSGTLQDHGRAVIVGRRSFGKGLVQRPILFSDGSSMRLTIAHYYTPSGRCIQKPYEKGKGEDYAGDIAKRFAHGELYHADSIHFADSLRYETLRLHRTVYGGGGIMPDVFVPIDTTQYTPFHRNLAAKGVILGVSMGYASSHRDELKAAFPSFEAFESGFTVPQSLVDELLSEAKKEKIEPSSDDEVSRSMPEILCQMKAFVARSLWSVAEYRRVVNPMQHVYQQGMAAMEHYSDYLPNAEP